MAITARLFAVTIDCPDPTRLARFYQEFLGGQLRSSSPDFVVLTSRHDVRLDFQRVANHQPPAWPDPAAPRRLHLDFAVEDLGQAEQHLLRLGAVLASQQPGGERFRVLLDPVGHPFCIATTAATDVPTDEPDRPVGSTHPAG
ncbi:VOC family protein [Nocardia sp. NPDC004278]